jgi:uncharacterized protein
MEISAELLNILVCPACKDSLVHEEASLVCQTCHLRYPVRDGIPVLLIEEAQPVQ